MPLFGFVLFLLWINAAWSATSCYDLFNDRTIQDTHLRPPGSPPPATSEQSAAHTAKVNLAWKKWLSLKGTYSSSELTNQQLIANLKQTHPEFYGFLEFVSPGFPETWSQFEVLQQRYIEYQRQNGSTDSQLFHLAVFTKLPNQQPSFIGRTYPDPSAQDLGSISSSVYLRALSHRLAPVEYGPLSFNSTGNFSTLHDLAHAYAFTQARFADAVLKMIPEVLRILQEDRDREMPKYEILSQVLEDYWELQPQDRAHVSQLMAPIKTIMERLQLFYENTDGYNEQNVALLTSDEATFLKNTFLQIRAIVQNAKLIRFGAAVTETVAIDRWNYAMDRHGNPLKFLHHIDRHRFFDEVAQPQIAGNFFRTVGYFLSREYATLVELETRSLDREINIVLSGIER